MVKHILKIRTINGSTYACIPQHIKELENIEGEKILLMSIEKVPKNDSE